MASGWSQPQPPAMMGNPFSPANPPSTGPQGFGAPQPPRFSAGSLISDNDLPEWLREGSAAGQQPWGAPQQAPAPQMPWQQAPQPMQAPKPQFSAPPPMPQQWAAPQAPQLPAPAPRQSDIASEFTVRQPAFGQPAPAAQQPFGQPSFSQPRQPNFSQAAPALPTYGQPPAFPPQQMPPQQMPYGQPAFPPSAPSQVNAFPSLDQAGMGRGAAPPGYPGGQPQLHQQPAPNWIGGGMAQQGMGQFQPRQPMPSGMQARSLVDDQSLPKWLRDQPEAAAPAARPSVADWMGSPSGQQAPQDMNALIAQAPNPVPLQPQAGGYGAISTERGQARENVGIYHSGAGNEPAMPDWLRSQAGAASGADAHAGAVGGFAASDLIDPAALPEWVSSAGGRAPAQQVFSSTHGWSSVNSDGGSTFGAAEQDYGAGFDTVNGKSIDAALSESAAISAQLPWDEAGNPAAPWGRVDAPDEMAYDEPAPQPRRGGQVDNGPFARHNANHPLGQEELPPWLKGKAGGQAPQSNRDPWGEADDQQGFDAGWNGGGQWDDRGGQAEQVWDERDAWDDGSAWDARGQGGQEQAWGGNDQGAARQMQNERAPRGRRDEPAYANDGYGGGGYDDYDAEYSANGYDQGYDQRYDERSYGRSQERGHVRESYDYQDEPEPEQRGGWFGGFMKRGRR